MEQTGTNTPIYYAYDGNGNLFLIQYEGQNYFYARNAQNDIVGLMDSSGNWVVEYTYDAWGKLLSTTGSMAATLGVRNPYRYRGYRFDAETGLYYLQSRYYDPQVGRFINADSVVAGVGGDIHGYNLYAYCFNNPVNMSDPSGHWPKWLSGALNVISGSLQMAAGTALGATVGWTGVGAVVAGFLVINGASTAAQGVGQIVNSVTKSNVMREDNFLKTGVQAVGKAVGGKTGGKVAGVVYDNAVVAANIYAGSVKKLLAHVSLQEPQF